MECVSETRLLSLLGGEHLDGLQIEVVVEMEVVQTTAMDKEVEGVEALTDNLETGLHPVFLSSLEEFSGAETAEKITTFLSLYVRVEMRLE